VRFIGSWSGPERDHGHTGPITCLEWSPDGRSLATGSYDGTAIVWSAETWSVSAVLWHSRLVNGIRWSPDQRYLATACADGHCRVWDPDSGEERYVFSRHTDDVNTLAWSPDSSSLMTVSEDGTGRLWSLADYSLGDGVVVHEDHCMSVDWSPDGVHLVTCGEDATIRLSTSHGETVQEVPHGADLEMVRWNHAGSRFAAAADDGFVTIFDLHGQEVQRLGPHGGSVKSVAWSPDGLRLASGAYDGCIRLWECDSGQLLSRFDHARVWPRSLHWSPGADVLAVGTQGGRPQLLALEGVGDGQSLRAVEEPSHLRTTGVNCLVVDGDAVVVGLDDGSIRICTPGSSAPRFMLDPREDRALVNALDGSAEDLVFGTFAGTVGRILGGTVCDVTVELGAPVNAVAWSPEGDVAAVATYDGSVSLVSASADGLEFHRKHGLELGAIKSLRWVDDGRLVVGATDGVVYAVDASGGHVLSVLRGHGNLVNAVSVSVVDGRPQVASASRDRTVRIWDLNSERCLQVLVGHTESVKSVEWIDAEAGVLASGSYDFDVRVWRRHESPWASTYCRVLPYHVQGVSSLASGPAGLVSGSWDGSVAAWSHSDGERLSTVHFGME
jgi:toxoflavin biosynthesis protein ToxC